MENGDATTADKTKCPICLQVPLKEIYQCRNGHIVCHMCFKMVKNCPQCRVPLESLRNRALEEILDTMTFDCIYKDLGCSVHLARKELAVHVNKCVHGGKEVQFCELLGLPCQTAVNTRKLAQALDHFRNDHRYYTFGTPNIGVSLAGFPSLLPGHNQLWKPVVLELDPSGNSLLVFLFSVLGEERMLSVTCLEFNGSEEQRSEYVCRFRISPVHSKDPEITWCTSPIQVKHISTAIKDPIFRFPYQILTQRYSQHNALIVTCNVLKNPGATPAPEPEPATPAEVQMANVPSSSIVRNEFQPPASSSSLASSSTVATPSTSTQHQHHFLHHHHHTPDHHHFMPAMLPPPMSMDMQAPFFTPLGYGPPFLSYMQMPVEFVPMDLPQEPVPYGPRAGPRPNLSSRYCRFRHPLSRRQF